MRSIEQIRAALRKMHARACGDVSKVYMSIPPDFDRDADLILEAAIDELDVLRDVSTSAKALLPLAEERAEWCVHEWPEAEVDARNALIIAVAKAAIAKVEAK